MKNNDFTTLSKLKIVLHNRTVFLGMFLTILVGFLFFGFLPKTDFAAMKYNSFNTAIIKGYLIEINKKNASINEQTIFEYHYNYQVKKNEYEESSYGVLTEEKIGDTIQVEYLTNNPSTSRIVGKTNNIFPFSTIIFLASFLFISLLFLIVPLRRGFKLFNLIQSGFEFSNAIIISKTKIPFFYVNRYKPLVFYTFSYTFNNQDYRLRKVMFSNLENKQYKILLNPSNPIKDIYIVDLFPKYVKFIVEND